MNLENASRILITAATVGSVSLSCKSNSAMSAYAKAKICGLWWDDLAANRLEGGKFWQGTKSFAHIIK
ncbi:hypothetical protein IAQ61_003801 [Plenodomus lingam]|uniref:uncharacterized protein n=1 Tax=Leptosphaeria maculans TaxID=5022 RepID=UPI003323502F|nr:hypothetical protein IAQ61_003801 [Plenodomus lingam]